MTRRGSDPFHHGTRAGEPDQILVTVIACLVILVVFIAVAFLL